ncbi:TetR/AcrR family transcriptional regulator [candidate division KSB1 bacterium]
MKKEIPADAKERILAAAIDVFIEKGKYGARMHEIAKKADINKAMLHYYYTDKDTLYEKSLEYIFTKIFMTVEQAFKKDIAIENKIKNFISIYIDFLAENVRITRLIMREIIDGAPVIKRIIGGFVTEENWLFSPVTIKMILDEAKSKGEIRDVDSIQTIISVLGMSVFYFLSKPVMDEIWNIKTEDCDEFVQKRKESIIDLVLNGIKVR